MEAEVEQKTSDACMALAKRLACGGGGVYLSRCHGYWGRKEERKKSGRTCFVISSCSSRGNVANWSNLVPMRKGIAVCTIIREGEKEINRVFRIFFFYKKKNSPGSKKKLCPTLLNPLAWRYHSFTEFRVDFRERSNMKRIATASLHTRGSIFTNSRWPPRSQIENVIVVRRTEIVFSIKLTPVKQKKKNKEKKKKRRWTRLSRCGDWGGKANRAFGYSPRRNCPRHTWPSNLFFLSASHRPSRPW